MFADRYLYTVGAKYQFVSPAGALSELRALPPDERGRRYSGIPRSDGRLVAVTSRNTRTLAIYDFSDPDTPTFLRAYELSGNPDLAAFWRGRVIIPAGHQGLIMEKFKQ